MASQQEKAFCALRFEVSRSVITVQGEFRERLHKDAPYKNNISRWYRHFVKTGCLCKGKSPGSRKLDMPKRSAWMVLRKWLCFKPYKMRLVQTLKPAVKEKRRDICEEMQLKIEDNGFVERLISPMKPHSTSVASCTDPPPPIFTGMYECFSIVFFHSAAADVLLQMETTASSLGHPVRRTLHRAIPLGFDKDSVYVPPLPTSIHELHDRIAHAL
ncbi:hypothetical protein B7P43_G05807 [Cryptotermes secundus]|uniref:Uncharacterized protein n=1 Tax=Cryptotermes secundus TaxID=105785 RepID=A0A2J7PNB9_9NEOP|nr:hypothetical protein B7P43_G05807 [Cryptotermes secundus]